MYLTKQTIKTCKDSMLSLDELVYMYTLLRNEDWGVELSTPSYMKLVRLGLVTDDTLTDEGITLVALALGEYEVPSVNLTKFDEFWKIYPYSDKVLNYPFTRVIRTNKIETKRAYTDAVLGGVSEDVIIEALKEHIEQLSSSTTRFKSNPFKYMKSPLRWLTDKDYLSVEKQFNDDFTQGADIA
jgi:hypothetical protein